MTLCTLVPHVPLCTAISLKLIAYFVHLTYLETRNLIPRKLFSINLHTYFFFQCIVKSKFGKEGDKCIRHPKDCDKGLSLSIWEKVKSYLFYMFYIVEAYFNLISGSSLHMKIQIMGRKMTENLGFKSLLWKLFVSNLF